MSNPSPPPEQTAASTPVSHAQADSTAATDAGLPVNHVPVLPTAPELPPTSPSQPDVPVASQGAPSAQTTLPTPIEGDLNKKSRPAALQRQSGPSLLTQALASARGIPAATPQTGPSQSPSLQPYDSQSIHPRHDQTIRQNPDTSTNLTTNDGPSTGNTSGSITPRSSSRSVAMASSATLTTTAAPPTLTGDVPILPTTFTLRNTDYRGVDKAPSSQRVPHGPFNTQSTSSNKRESDHKSFELPIRTGPFNNILDHDTTASPTVLEQRSATQPSLNQPDTSRESRHSRPRKMEPRVSMGPEKAWSIGTGDLDMHQDGQVEKSITEVLSGLEPNRGSRKASHSLRFFKEGLPEDKIKRRETRLTPSREKLSPTAEVPIDADKSGTKGSTQHYQDAFPSPKSIDDKYAEQLSADDNSVRSPLPALGDVRSSHDYFGDAGKELRDRVLTGDASTESSIHRRDEDSRLLHEEENRPLGEERERRRSSEATKSDEHTEDGDESGEEKISSAVFLPHQGLEESTELEPARSNDIQHPQAASGAHPRKEDFHPWLVKADEPEADVTSPEEEKFEGAPRPAQEGRHNHTHDTAYPAGYNVSLAGDTEAVEVSHHGVVRPLSHQYEDHVHDHQHRQPLEAIELIPYRHQVGGHTTLWRFSKRAVCKQLNNRENEFYERIERFHRDLLAFLPRYIGVLNVTFHKQPRRRSTVRKDEGASHERKQIDQDALRQVLKANGASAQEGVAKSEAPREAASAHTRVISQSMQSASNQVPTVTFVDNQHILPRNLLQPTSLSPRGSPKSLAQRREVPIEIPPEKNINPLLARPSLEDRHANSWGATTVNKKLRNEVFNDAFLKQPIAIQRHHNKANRRAIPRKTLQQILRQSNSDPNLVSSPMRLGDDHSHGSSTRPESPSDTAEESQRMSIDLPRPSHRGTNGSNEPKDVTGTSAPEPDILSEQPPSQRKKRRYSGTVLRRKPKDVSESRGDLHVFEEPDDAGCKADHEDEGATTHLENGSAKEEFSRTPTRSHHGQDVDFAMGGSTYPSTVTSRATSPTAEFHKIPRPINPKEAQTQRDSRREYFLLLEDLTAGMKRPCIMDLKMGTRQYGVDANPKKQKSQQRKCAETTSRELGVRVCGLQVWDIPTQSYVFKDKYYGRDIKAGQEFQDALTRFLYDGADPSSILRHIPTVLNKLSQLEVIISRLKGYRFYAASLLMFYDGDQSDEGNDNAIEDSTTDFATDTEEHRDQRRRRNKREIDFKMADFANSVMAGDLTGGKPCPPQHPNEPDHGFLRGLRSLRRYFLKIQRDTRVQMDLAIPFRENGSDIDLRNIDDESAVSE